MSDAQPLRHYSRKKFFYRLFLRRSPRNAAVFGFGWMLFCLLSLPGFLLLVVFPWFASVSKTNFHTIIGVLCLIFFLFLLFYCYGLFMLGFAYSGLVRKVLSARKVFQQSAAICALFIPAGILVIGPILWKQKQKTALCLASAAVILMILFFLTGSRNSPIPLGSSWILNFGCIALFTAALALIRDNRRFRPASLLPLFLLLLYSTGLLLYDRTLSAEIAEQRDMLARLTGRPVDPAGFWREQEKGMPLTAEPLATLIASAPQESLELPVLPLPGDFLTCLQAYRQANPAFMAAVRELRQLPPQPIRHIRPSDDLLASINLSELNSLREAGRLTAGELIAAAADRQAVLRLNADLIRLRNWCAADFSLIAKLVAMSIEKMRLDSLRFALTADSLTDDDFKTLASEQANWGDIFIDAFADEATAFESCINFVQSQTLQALSNRPTVLPVSVQRFLPLEVGIWLKRDWRFAQSYYLLGIRLFRESAPASSGTVQASQFTDLNKELRRKGFLLSGMQLPALNMIHVKQAEIEDAKLLADTAFQVERYRRKYGKLPETLEALVPEFLPVVPLDRMNRLPIRYEHGDLKFKRPGKPEETHRGYRLYTCEYDGKNIGGTKARNTFAVLFPAD